jgi:hypothetical protein
MAWVPELKLSPDAFDEIRNGLMYSGLNWKINEAFPNQISFEEVIFVRLVSSTAAQEAAIMEEERKRREKPDAL